jgi:hypothetical protein
VASGKPVVGDRKLPIRPCGIIRYGDLGIALVVGERMLHRRGPVLAASDRDWNDCKAEDPERSISGCTRIKQSRGETKTITLLPTTPEASRTET